MLVRIVHFLIGAVFAGGGGYLVWTQRTPEVALFPPAAAGVPWLLILGILLAVTGVVFLVSAVAPRPNRKARLAAEAERRKETIRAADTYYSERARAADRDWRSGELPPATPPAPRPEPAPKPAAAAPPPGAPEPAPRPASMKPVAAAAPPQAPSPNPFPAAATLAPIPRASEPPPPPTQPAMAANVVNLAGATSFAAIRAAIAEGRLDEADRMLNTEREGAQGEALAELTGLAGDHAAAAGRQSNAKWLWRLALKRFGEANAMNSPAARAVSERLRLSDN